MEVLNDYGSDPVSSVLTQIEVRSTVYCLSELGAPWGFRVEGRNVAKFHLVLDGSALLEIDGREPTQLEAGDLVLLPHGHSHTMRDHHESAVEGLDRILLDHPVDDRARMAYGGEGPQCRLLCGGFGLDALPETLRPLLPTLIRIDGRTGRITGWLGSVFELLRTETADAQPGAQAVFAKLADVFLTQAIRLFLIGVHDGGLLNLTPFADPQVSDAVALIHQDPAASWTVPTLAAEVGLSRSAFTDRFKTSVGEPPMRYVALTRLSRAAGLLATTDATIYQIARECGYDTDESLSKAFKRRFSTTPGAYRKQTTTHPALTAQLA